MTTKPLSDASKIGFRMHDPDHLVEVLGAAREILARAMEPQFPVEAEMARKDLHFMLPQSWAVSAIQDAIAEQAAEIQRLREGGQFLLDRLRDYENAMTSDADAREYHGHVAPAASRFCIALNGKDKP
jgi:uncharacterized coiled-coil protein SlyX